MPEGLCVCHGAYKIFLNRSARFHTCPTPTKNGQPHPTSGKDETQPCALSFSLTLSHSLCLRPSLISFPNVKRLKSREWAQIRTAPVHACVCTHVLAHVKIHRGRTNQAKYSAVFGIGLLAFKVPVTVYDRSSCIYKILTAGICLSGLEKFKINCNA